MYQPCIPYLNHVRLVFGFLWNMTLVTGGAKCVLLKSKLPSVISFAEMLGLCLEGLSMFRVICYCYSSLYHRCIGNNLSVPLTPETK